MVRASLGGQMARVPRRRMLLGGLAWALAAGCISPTLPLPPPDTPNIDGPTAEGTATLSGRVPQPSARVYAINWTQIEAGDTRAIGGDVADGAGNYRFVIRADVGDQCTLYYEYSGDESQDRYFEIPEPTP
jgi:hypothetical protein